MTKLRLNNDFTTGLVAVCDVCGALITDGQEANICWTPKRDEKPGDFFDYRIACKVECTHALDRRLGHQYTQELGTGIFYLINNAAIDLKQAGRNSVKNGAQNSHFAHARAQCVAFVAMTLPTPTPLPNESLQAFAAFAAYTKMGTKRSIRAVACRCHKECIALRSLEQEKSLASENPRIGSRSGRGRQRAARHRR